MENSPKKMLLENSIPGLRVEPFIDPITGAQTVHYLWKDIIVPKIQLTGKIAETISGLTLIQKDLENAKRWVKRALELTSAEAEPMSGDVQYVHLKERTSADEAKAFFVAGLTFYAKAFTEAAGRRAQLQRNDLALEFRDTHDYYMDFRHNFAAHSGDLKLEHATSYLLLIPHPEGTRVQLATRRVQPDVVLSDISEDSFLSLIEHVISIVNEKYYDAGKNLINAAVARPEAFWQIAAQINAPVDMDQTIRTARKKNQQKR